MRNEVVVDAATGRKFFLDHPDRPGGDLTFLLNLHGGGSAGVWQRSYFPAHEHADDLRLVVASPSAATKKPTRHWAPDADDEHLRNVVETVFDRFGSSIRSFWLVGHSQGGMTSYRLLTTPFFAEKVDGWLSLSGGRIGAAPMVPGFGPPRTEEERAAMSQFMSRMRIDASPDLEADLSFIYAVGEHEIVSLPERSPWAEKYGAGSRVRHAEVVDEEPGQVHDTRWGPRSTLSWGRAARPGRAEIHLYPGARDQRVIADVVRIDKGHTEGLEPNITREILRLMVGAPGGKAQRKS